MRIEILFPEVCNLFGDMSNMRYLKKCLPEAEFLETPLDQEPLFLSEPAELVYLGPMTERTQERVIQKLLPFRKRLQTLIEAAWFFSSPETLWRFWEAALKPIPENKSKH